MRTSATAEARRLLLFACSSLLLAVVFIAAPVRLQAQAESRPEVPVLAGRVTFEGEGVPAADVTLHRITAAESGPVQSVATDETGDFTFLIPPVDDSAFTIYFATTDFQSVRFFGPPLHADSASSVEYELPVYDTTSVLAEPVRVTSRYMFMLPNLTGGWEVLEILGVLNPTRHAYVASDGMPPWEFRLPEGASEFQVGDGGVLPHELSWIDDRVMYVTPLTPGSRDVLVSYRLPDGPTRSTLRFEEPTDTFHLFVRQPAHLTGVTGVQAPRSISVEGEEFLQYSAIGLEPGSEIELIWSSGSGLPVDPVVLAVTITLVLLAVGVVAAMRRRRVPVG